ncbi:uncharacterized protein LOC131638429 [Vicia villosa]|uniref:uncharacterized protein LOC131638429 n=1 Tax=Vicia villosa TaxID=3911 RepID=UPI00273BF7D6|nr:uncharacterized protein LOC131638429 [Vicia villosa]
MSLEVEFSSEEIRAAVWDSDGDKSPGPDVLANRLKKVLENIISPTQSAFVPGRQILDGVLALNEIVDHAKRQKRECFVFKSSLSILVNGCPTKDFVVERGLRQGDPLSPFLFTLVVEGLAVLFNSATTSGSFVGYSISNNVDVKIPQFADDTVIVEQGSWQNLWSIKSIFKGFELILGLKVNFHKSKVMGVNVAESFLETASHFLGCSREKLPFKFLGIQVGLNPRIGDSWKLVLNGLKNKLSCWKSRSLSIGGRIKGVNWVSWHNICKPKAEGGLGIKHIDHFNNALLSKWKWRILKEGSSLWKNILESRYGDVQKAVLLGVDFKLRKTDSIWWKDMMAASMSKTNGLDCFAGNISFKLGDGKNIMFWFGRWFGGAPLKNRFPLLFSLSRKPQGSIMEMGVRVGLVWLWNFQVDSNVLMENPGAMMEALELLELLGGVRPKEGVEDMLKWSKNSDGNFTVKSCSSCLREYNLEAIVESTILKAINRFWCSEVPSRIKVFG